MRLALALALASSTAHAAPPADADVARVADALSVRHDPPACADLAVLVARPGPVLVAVAERIESPPWVGPRAARCAVHHAEARAAVGAWLVDPDRAGLALLAVQALDELPEAEAMPLARAAAAGPLGGRLAATLRASAHPALRALAVRP